MTAAHFSKNPAIRLNYVEAWIVKDEGYRAKGEESPVYKFVLTH